MVDVLTWQGLRTLATCEAIAEGPRLRYVAPAAKRPTDVCRMELSSVRDLPFTLHRFWPSVRVTVGGIVYARDSWRAPWREAMVKGAVPHVLMTAFSDPHITQSAADLMLREGSPVKTWFGVQVEAQHPRLRAMPLGVDGRKVQALRAATWRVRDERDVLLFVNFRLRDQERHDVWDRFADWPDALATDWVPGSHGDADYFDGMGRARFVISPPGRGWDCYRTYEAIAMGAVPIVRRRPPLSDVCNGLPVLQVDRWEDVTRELLDRTWDTLTGSVEKLRLSYWAAQIRIAAQAAKEQHYADLQGTPAGRR